MYKKTPRGVPFFQKNGGATGIQTLDLRLAKAAL